MSKLGIIDISMNLLGIALRLSEIAIPMSYLGICFFQNTIPLSFNGIVFPEKHSNKILSDYPKIQCWDGLVLNMLPLDL